MEYNFYSDFGSVYEYRSNFISKDGYIKKKREFITDSQSVAYVLHHTSRTIVVRSEVVLALFHVLFAVWVIAC